MARGSSSWLRPAPRRPPARLGVAIADLTVAGPSGPSPFGLFTALSVVGVPDARRLGVIGGSVAALEAGHRAGAGAIVGIAAAAPDARRPLLAGQPDVIIEAAGFAALDAERWASGRAHRQRVLLNPGPSVVSDRVHRAIGGPDLCHREPEYTEPLLAGAGEAAPGRRPGRRLGRRAHRREWDGGDGGDDRGGDTARPEAARLPERGLRRADRHDRAPAGDGGRRRYRRPHRADRSGCGGGGARCRSDDRRGRHHPPRDDDRPAQPGRRDRAGHRRPGRGPHRRRDQLVRGGGARDRGLGDRHRGRHRRTSASTACPASPSS